MNDSNNDSIGKALNLEPISTQVQTIIQKANDDSAKTDFEAARANVYEIIESGASAMQSLAQIADSSQHPRAFEVLAKLMETMLQANKDLLQLQKEIRDIDNASQPSNEKAQNVTNNLFVGSTAELQKVLEKFKNGGPATES